MNRDEKVRISLDFQSAHAFRQGLFLRLYEASLCWFVHNARPLKIMPEVTKQGETLLYGGLPMGSFEALIAESKFSGLQSTDYGYKWDSAAHSVEQTYQQWRKEQLASLPERPAKKDAKLETDQGGDILERVRTFELALATPVEAMNAIASWQEALRGLGKEGA